MRVGLSCKVKDTGVDLSNVFTVHEFWAIVPICIPWKQYCHRWQHYKATWQSIRLCTPRRGRMSIYSKSYKPTSGHLSKPHQHEDTCIAHPSKAVTSSHQWNDEWTPTHAEVHRPPEVKRSWSLCKRVVRQPKPPRRKAHRFQKLISTKPSARKKTDEGKNLHSILLQSVKRRRIRKK